MVGRRRLLSSGHPPPIEGSTSGMAQPYVLSSLSFVGRVCMYVWFGCAAWHRPGGEGGLGRRVP